MSAQERLLWMGAGVLVWLLIDLGLSLGRRRLGWPDLLTVELVQYVVVPALYIGALANAPAPFALRATMTDLQFGCFALNVGYFAYGGLRGLTRLGREPRSIFVHHASLGVGSVALFALSPMLQCFCWAGSVQLSSTVHEIGRVLRKAGLLPPARWARFMTLELVNFIFCRWLVFTPLAVWMLVDAIAVQPRLVVIAWVIGLFLPLMIGLHWVWLRATWRRWQRAQAAARAAALAR